MNPTDQEIIEKMEQRGGHFVRCLAACFKTADPENFGKLKSTFIHYWTNYRLLCEAEMQVEAREMEVAL